MSALSEKLEGALIGGAGGGASAVAVAAAAVKPAGLSAFIEGVETFDAAKTAKTKEAVAKLIAEAKPGSKEELDKLNPKHQELFILYNKLMSRALKSGVELVVPQSCAHNPVGDIACAPGAIIETGVEHGVSAILVPLEVAVSLLKEMLADPMHPFQLVPTATTDPATMLFPFILGERKDVVMRFGPEANGKTKSVTTPPAGGRPYAYSAASAIPTAWAKLHEGIVAGRIATNVFRGEWSGPPAAMAGFWTEYGKNADKLFKNVIIRIYDA